MIEGQNVWSHENVTFLAVECGCMLGCDVFLFVCHFCAELARVISYEGAGMKAF